MSTESNIVSFPGNKHLNRDQIIEHLERLQMASEATVPAEKMEEILLQLLSYVDKGHRE